MAISGELKSKRVAIKRRTREKRGGAGDNKTAAGKKNKEQVSSRTFWQRGIKLVDVGRCVESGQNQTSC